jgi:hypothetical protein
MITLDTLRRKHKTWQAESSRWTLYNSLMSGGIRVTDRIKGELLSNPDGRPAQIINARVKNSPYVNVIGSALTRLISNLFDQRIEYMGDSDPYWTEEFIPNSAFVLDTDDDARASLNMGLEASIRQALVEGQAIAEVSTRFSGTATNLKEQIDLQENQPYIVLLPRSAMWDWKPSDRGFQYVKLHKFRMIQENWDDTPTPEHHFSIYRRDGDRILNSQYVVRLKELPKDGIFNIDTVTADLVTIEPVTVGDLVYEDVEIFNVNGVYKFPVITLTMPDNLWLVSQLFDLCKEYFNTRSALNWKLNSINFSMPVVTMPPGMDIDEFKEEIEKMQKMGDGFVYYVPSGTTVGTLEMGGSGIAAAENRLALIKQDIAEQLQQISASAASTAAALGRSGLAKIEDKKSETVMMRVYGFYLKLYAGQLLECCSIAYGKIQQWQVSGLDSFSGDILSELLADLTLLAPMQIPSDTFKSSLDKRVIDAAGAKYTLSKDEVEQAKQEVDTAPPDAEVESLVQNLGI